MRAEQFPLRIYSAADGLPRDSFLSAEQDSRGLLRVFTGDGLTRFDDYNFRLSKLDAFGGDFRGAEMGRAYLDSAEYRRSFGR